MEKEKEVIYCPNCGMKYGTSNTYCIHCGFNRNSSQNIVNPNNTQDSKPVKEKMPAGATVYLVVSALAIVFAVPTIFEFAVIWLLFGAFSGNALEYYSILYACIGLIIFFIFSLVISLINIGLKGKYTFKSIIIAIILTIIGLLSLFIIQMNGDKISEIGLKKAPIEKNKVIYKDSSYEIKQKEVKYNHNKIIILLDIEGEVNNIYNHIEGRVNNCYIYGAKIEKAKDGYYKIEISNNEFQDYNITEPKQIDIKLPMLKEKMVTIKTNKASNNNQQQLPFEKVGLLYQNNYFKIYYNPNFKSSADIYIESLVSNNYHIEFKKIDFDTLGYINTFYSFKMYDYTITHNSISFHPCNDNLSYLKGEYIIYDETHKMIINRGIIDEKYKNPKIDKRNCRAK